MLAITGIAPYLIALSAACTDSAAGTAHPAMARVSVTGSPSLRKLYTEGKTFQQFLAAADSKREQWLSNYRNGRVSDSLVTRARAVEGDWRLLVIAEDWCSDSVNTIPYMARLVEAVRHIEMRIVASKRGRSVMKAHKTPDGRAATPTVILLDSRYREAGCWIERPSQLQRWFQKEGKQLSDRDLREQKSAWYANDKGEQTVREIVEMMEAAAAGRSRCARKG